MKRPVQYRKGAFAVADAEYCGQRWCIVFKVITNGFIGKMKLLMKGVVSSQKIQFRKSNFA